MPLVAALRKFGIVNQRIFDRKRRPRVQTVCKLHNHQQYKQQLSYAPHKSCGTRATSSTATLALFEAQKVDLRQTCCKDRICNEVTPLRVSRPLTDQIYSRKRAVLRVFIGHFVSCNTTHTIACTSGHFVACHRCHHRLPASYPDPKFKIPVHSSGILQKCRTKHKI